MRVLALALSIVAVAGCETAHKVYDTSFLRTGSAEFTYISTAESMTNPEGTPEGERFRMRILESYLRDNRMCPAGYEVADRQSTMIADGLLGTTHRILYRGRCKG